MLLFSPVPPQVFGSVGDFQKLEAECTKPREGDEPRNVEVFGNGRQGRSAELPAAAVKKVQTLLDGKQPLHARDAEVFDASECATIAPVEYKTEDPKMSGRNLEY